MQVEKSKSIQWPKLCRQISVALLLLILTLLLLLLIGYQLLPVRHVQWSGLTVGLQQIRLAGLSFQAGQGEQWWDLQLQNLAIDWRGWPLPQLQVQQLRVSPVFEAAALVAVPVAVPVTIPADAAATAAEFQLPQWPELTIPGWLPQQLDISELSLQLPCQTAQRQFCQLLGALHTSRENTSSENTNHNIDLQLQGDGQKVQLQAALVEKNQQLAQLHLRQLQLQLDVQALATAGWLQGLPAGLVPATIKLQLAGHWQADELQLSLLQPAAVDFSYQNPAAPGQGLHLPSAQVQLHSGQLQCPDARWQQCKLELKATAAARQLQHPLLKTSDWQWQGQAQGLLSDLQLSGTLHNPQALKISYQAKLSPSTFNVQWQLADVFLLAGNPLQISRLWPELLELQRGKLHADGQLQLQLPGGKLNNLQLNAQLHELYGIYDRTAFGGLTAQVVMAGDPRSFTLNLPELTLKQLQHGFQAGPAQLTAQYRADWSAPTSGEVRLGQAQLAIFGGQLSFAETQFKLQQPAIEFNVAVQQIQLAELLKQHPSSQLLGDGVLSGTIPIRYQQVKPAATKNTLAQWQVFGGSLQAEAPGGRLQYQYQAVPGQKASGLDLAFEALSDFRYQTLASTVELQPDGKVLLQVKLHGFNPKLQQGRPVHFNINVEEDLPALLTSLQLSGQISDKVRQRIQQKIQHKTKPETKPETQQKPVVKPAAVKQ